MPKKKSKNLLDVVSSKIKIPTKDGGFVMGKRYGLNILIEFIENKLKDSSFEDLKPQDQDDIDTAMYILSMEDTRKQA